MAILGRGPGTNQRRTPDTQRLAAAMAGPGIDTRLWVSYGTVCTVGDDGVADFTDYRAIYVGPEGVEVDVLLEPANVPVTCHYYGVQGGCMATIVTPIRPGDRVVVILPDGETPVIVAILHSASCKVPLGPDRKPIFQNDRIMVWADEDVPVDIRNKAGARVQMTAEGEISAVPVDGQKVKMGATVSGDLEDAALGNTLASFLGEIRSFVNGHVHTSAAPSNPTSPPTTQLGGVPDVTSSNVQVKK